MARQKVLRGSDAGFFLWVAFSIRAVYSGTSSTNYQIRRGEDDTLWNKVATEKEEVLCCLSAS